MKKLLIIPFCLVILMSCGINKETTIQKIDPVSSIEPISELPGEVTVVSEVSELTYAIFNSASSTAEAEIYEAGDKLTISFIDTALLEETEDESTPLYYKIEVDPEYQHDYLIVLVNGEDAVSYRLLLQ
ncbi:MAG: hypothetical protein PWR19_2051 [Carnobacterium sp.]|uniref:hypothetical protein n=1 Tax=Carnobacterium sp. TaxID=48221 RepID=UPI002647C6DA|nr:hypothetical protein [Carnobacterium sp.]MDN5373005.1 hypothetical protein [Carnobacterium sp.]